MSKLFVDGYNEVKNTVVKTKNETVSLVGDIHKECFTFDAAKGQSYVQDNYKNWYFIPYFPAFHRPGWLLRYVVGPHDFNLLESVFFDIWAGITVALTLIPQVISFISIKL